MTEKTDTASLYLDIFCSIAAGTLSSNPDESGVGISVFAFEQELDRRGLKIVAKPSVLAQEPLEKTCSDDHCEWPYGPCCGAARRNAARFKARQKALTD